MRRLALQAAGEPPPSRPPSEPGASPAGSAAPPISTAPQQPPQPPSPRAPHALVSTLEGLLKETWQALAVDTSAGLLHAAGSRATYRALLAGGPGTWPPLAVSRPVHVTPRALLVDSRNEVPRGLGRSRYIAG